MRIASVEQADLLLLLLAEDLEKALPRIILVVLVMPLLEAGLEEVLAVDLVLPYNNRYDC